MDEYVNNFTIAVNNIIKHRFDIHTMTETDANILHDMLIRIQTDP